MDLLLAIGGGLLIILVAALVLFLMGMVFYLLYIPTRIGWWAMRTLFDKFGLLEVPTAAETAADALTEIRYLRRKVSELSEQIGALHHDLSELSDKVNEHSDDGDRDEWKI